MSVEGMATAEQERSDAALTAFVAEHYDRLLRLARLVSRDAGDAADAVQLGLEQAWRRRATLRDARSLQPWLDRIVVREAVRTSRRRQSWLGRLFTHSPDVTWIEVPDTNVGDPSTAVDLRSAFEQISPDQRAVVALHLHLGYTVAETAAIVGVPEETVRSRLRSAKQQLRRQLEGSRT